MEYSAPLKTTRITATRDTVAGGTLELLSSTGDPLAIFTLSASGGTVSGDTWTITFVSNSTTGTSFAGTGETITSAHVRDSSNAIVISALSVGISASDVIVDNTNIAEDQSIEITSAAIQHG